MAEVASLLTCLKGREDFTSRYLYLADRFSYEHKILIFKEKNSANFIIPSDIDVSVIETDNEIGGMNDIFKVLNKYKQIILEYKYCHFVEDDNFIFAKSQDRFIAFLENTVDYSAVVGKAFLHSKPDFIFINNYDLPSIESATTKERLEEFKGGLTYYSLFRSDVFSNICDVVSCISDDNMSELSFNIVAVAKTRVKFLNELFLAREYPRPKIYNVPPSLEWLTNPKFSAELKNLIGVLSKELNLGLSDQDFFNLTLAQYFSKRFFTSKKISYRGLIRNFQNITIKNSYEVKNYLRLLKTLHT